MSIISINSLFDVIGPIMIGPSSSHTAGAARLGKVSKLIVKHPIKSVTFNLYGSFARTYKGHGTDMALVAGVLGMEPMDENLSNSFQIAKDKNLEFIFNPLDKDSDHPNTVEFIFQLVDGKTTQIKGVSLGGGRIEIFEIDYEEIKFSGEYPTIIINHRDVPGVISSVTDLLYKSHVNVAFMRVFRHKKGKQASMIFELDNIPSEDTLDKIRCLESIDKFRFISPLESID